MPDLRYHQTTNSILRNKLMLHMHSVHVDHAGPHVSLGSQGLPAGHQRNGRALAHNYAQSMAGPMARNMEDLILLDGVLRSSNVSSRGNGAVPAPGVSCSAVPDRGYDLRGINIGLPVDYWEGELGVEAAVRC